MSAPSRVRRQKGFLRHVDRFESGALDLEELSSLFRAPLRKILRFGTFSLFVSFGPLLALRRATR